ncbi:phosphoglycolate phosphatase [Aquabacterium sp.]|uniref:phosphoglycolate phosphatase n=1 Tax=Aquabacterium sp. TaxID=1872578 RepID=UPI003D6D0DDA
MSIQLITFDLDGTMVDTAAEIAEAANRTLAEIGLPRRPLGDVTKLIGHGTRELMKGLLREATEAGESKVVAKLDVESVMHCFERHYNDTTGTDSQLYPGCLDGLERLRTAGVRLACVTNKEVRFAHKVLEVTGLAHFFQIVLGGDSLAEKKPHPLVIEYCLGALNVDKSHTAHVGDSSIDVETAKRAGVTAWAVPYGYNGGQPIEDSHPDGVFTDIARIADHVLNLRMAA